ncbi:MAG: hypothetical protein R3F56_03815 [Planctomycetota bacterium]
MTRNDKAQSPAAALAHPHPDALATITRGLAAPPRPLTLAALGGRSLFPLLALLILAGTLLWGPFVSLALAVVTWNLVGRFG